MGHHRKDCLNFSKKNAARESIRCEQTSSARSFTPLENAMETREEIQNCHVRDGTGGCADRLQTWADPHTVQGERTEGKAAFLAALSWNDNENRYGTAFAISPRVDPTIFILCGGVSWYSQPQNL
jgi:hypothetical protein